MTRESLSKTNKQLYDYTDYKRYLASLLETTGSARGMRTRMAVALGCQNAFISQVLNGHVHFSLEHAMKITIFLELSEDESHFFMLLVHLGRAGSETLKNYYRTQMEEFLKKRALIHERIRAKQTLTKEDQATYYSAWYFAATHVLLSVPGFQSVGAIAKHLKFSFSVISKCLEFLVSHGLAIRQGDRFKIGTTRIHLGQDSPLISKHHTNWRMKAIQSLDAPMTGDLHYSSVISLSESDAEKVRGMILDALEKTEPILKASKEEAVFGLSMDFFRI